jgi:twitching motility protein PilT
MSSAPPDVSLTLSHGTAAGPLGAGRPGIDRLLVMAVNAGASDLHLRPGAPPWLRVDGTLRVIDAEPILTADEIRAITSAIRPHRNRDEIATMHDTDFAYATADGTRFRVNVFHEHAGPGAVFRRITTQVVSADDLGLSPEVQRLCQLRRGLVLVTGPTGAGKSTTLTAMIDLVNRTRSDHIVTIEDPIEFVHQTKRSIVTQREVGVHAHSFKRALRAALREDPDVVFIGEMRDLETVAIALETAETGHLVFATLHTTTASSTIERIIDQFPGDQQEQIRAMLAGSLRAVISQILLKTVGGGRTAAREVLFNTTAIANLIRERKTFQMMSIMQTSKRLGMVTMNDALTDLVLSQKVDVLEAYEHAMDKGAFAERLRSANVDVSMLPTGPSR